MLCKFCAPGTYSTPWQLLFYVCQFMFCLLFLERGNALVLCDKQVLRVVLSPDETQFFQYFL